MDVLEARQLNKRYGDRQAVKDVSFSIPAGSVFGLIGRNGAGKTTTIRMMMNIIGPDSGSILLNGRPAGAGFRRMTSYLPEERGLYPKMKVLDVLRFLVEIKGIRFATVKSAALDYLEHFQLAERRQSRIEDLSKGNQQKVQFIAAILSDPRFIVLDEPFSGLDPVNTALLKDIIQDLKQRGKIIVLSTHLMDFAERLCDHIALIHDGHLLLNGALPEIKARHGRGRVTLVHEGELDFLEGHPLIAERHVGDGQTRIRLSRPDDSQALLRLLLERGVRVQRFAADDVSLQEIFLQLAGGDSTVVTRDSAAAVPAGEEVQA